eukprot:TRINITY_DN6718_c0_g1_i3.p1 TRINITY_DN6718_c0_g1~~TRINITY_DN6718_c0_g1_i3.p1  ORF type:complete len:134 (-),score=27.41 TRINITY_DN6718_c0_g1_i3:82-483(-)
MIRRPPRSTQGVSSAASDVYKRQVLMTVLGMALAQNCVPQHIFYSMASEDEIKIGVYWETLDDCPQEISYTTPDGKTLSQKPGLLSSRDKKYIHYSTFHLSLIHISEPTRPLYISYAVFCLKKKKQITRSPQP